MKRMTGKVEVVIKSVVAALISLCFLVTIYKLGGIWFETNDDVIISEMLSGKITGTPEFHSPYVGALVMWPISLLYRLCGGIPWWGGFIFFVLFCVLFLNLYSVMGSAQNLKSLIIRICVTMCIFVAGIYCFGQAQFTSAAILLAASGYVFFIANIESKHAWVIFIFCELLACQIRDSSMFLVQPLGFAALIGAEFVNERNNVKNLIKKAVSCVIMVLGVIAVTKIVSAMEFRGAAWKDYYKFNEFQMYIIDYEPPVQYEALSDILDKYDITEDEYEQILEYRTWYPNNKFTGACLDELLPRLVEIRKSDTESINYVESIRQLFLTSSEFWHLHQFTAIFFLLAVLIALLIGKKKMLISIGMTFAGYFFGLIILGLRNRFVLRVMQPYYLATLLLVSPIVVGMLLQCKFGKAKENATGIATVLAAGAVILWALQIGRVQFAYFRRQNNFVNPIDYSTNYEIMDYCRKHPDKHFVLDNSYARFVSTDIFETRYYDKANYIYSGSWYSNTPEMLEYCKNYIGEDCYYLVYEAREFKGLEGADFYARMFDTEMRLEEKFKLTSGATMWVYHIKK